MTKDTLPSPGDAREIARRINGQIFIVEDEERIEAITAAILSARREGIEKAAAWHDPRVEWETARDNPLAANFHRQAAAAIRSLSSPEEGTAALLSAESRGERKMRGENAALIHDNGNLLASLSGECAARVSAEGERDTATRAAFEKAAALLDMVAAPYDDSEIGEEAADAFNSGAPRRPMDQRLRDWNAVLSKHIRALSKTEGK